MFSPVFNANVKTGFQLEQQKMMQLQLFSVFAYFQDASFRLWMQHIALEWSNLFTNFEFLISGELSYFFFSEYIQCFLVRCCATIVSFRIFRTS